ncbi:MAG: Rv2175c family DNA-binding protein [Jatrophihabitans sp.]
MDLLTLPDAALALDVSITRLHQYVRDGELVITRTEQGVRMVPSLFLDGGVIVKSLPAVITLLRDARYADDEIIDWLYREDDSLPGSPIEALRANRGSEVKRRAQVAGF